jgi:DNA-binding response OmpR family regulator
VVVVNDTAEILELFGEVIHEMGHRMTPLTYAPDDAATIADLDPDLVIVDFVLGGREFQGWQLLQKLRMNRRTERVPLLACTAAVVQVREMEGQLTAQDIRVLLKPFRVSELERAISAVWEDGTRDEPSARSARATGSE